MKRSREEKIMLDALQGTGFEITDSVVVAVSSGLKQIRKEKFEERTIRENRTIAQSGEGVRR